MNDHRSGKAFLRAKRFIPGGVDSPVRAFTAIGRSPLFIDNASGPWLCDIDGNRYADYCLSWGVHILGHTHPRVLAAARKALTSGTSFGAPSTLETVLARRIAAAVPSLQRIRFVNSGTEAVMSAVRLARAFTGRSKILKFDGCYHGHVDHLLVAAGSGAGALNKSSSAGVPAAFVGETISIPFNDEKAVEKAFKENPGKIAAVIVEPVPANMGVILPQEGFLPFLRKIAAGHDTLLIFDEVITGFRWHYGCAQGHFGIVPDLTTLGKIIGGGFPVGAFGGKKEIMDLLAPEGPVYQAGTLSGNPVAMAAGIAVLEQIARKGFYKRLNDAAGAFLRELAVIAGEKHVTVNSLGTMFSIFFSRHPVNRYTDLKRCDIKRFARFYRTMLEAGIYLSPAQGEANFISVRHSAPLLKSTLETIRNHLFD